MVRPARGHRRAESIWSQYSSSADLYLESVRNAKPKGKGRFRRTAEGPAAGRLRGERRALYTGRPKSQLGCSGSATNRCYRPKPPIQPASRKMRPAALLTLALAALLLDTASAKKGKRKTKSKSKGNPPEGRPGGPGGHRPITQGPYIDPKTRPDPDLDPTAFLVDFLVAGTVDGERGQDIGTFTLKVSPNWAPIGVERMRKVSLPPPPLPDRPHPRAPSSARVSDRHLLGTSLCKAEPHAFLVCFFLMLLLLIAAAGSQVFRRHKVLPDPEGIPGVSIHAIPPDRERSKWRERERERERKRESFCISVWSFDLTYPVLLLDDSLSPISLRDPQGFA